MSTYSQQIGWSQEAILLQRILRELERMAGIVGSGGGGGGIPVSSTNPGIVDNTPMQELGGADKTIHTVKIGLGGGSLLNNLALGSYALQSNTTGFYNVAVGNNDGTDTLGTLSSNTIGNYNTVVGAYAMALNVSGTANTAVGVSALGKNVEGYGNVAIGSAALAKNVGVGQDQSTNGARNVAVGYNAMEENVSGWGNTALGDTALASNLSGANNIAIGQQAGCAVTGSRNVIIAATGFSGYNGLTSGSNNLIIAPNNGNATGITTGSGNVVIGKVTGLAAAASNTVTIANGVGNIRMSFDSSGQMTLVSIPTAGSGGFSEKILLRDTSAGAVKAVDYVAVNTTTTALTKSNLDTSYPAASIGFRVICMSISGGALIYTKSGSTTWASHSVTNVT